MYDLDFAIPYSCKYCGYFNALSAVGVYIAYYVTRQLSCYLLKLGIGRIPIGKMYPLKLNFKFTNQVL